MRSEFAPFLTTFLKHVDKNGGLLSLLMFKKLMLFRKYFKKSFDENTFPFQKILLYFKKAFQKCQARIPLAGRARSNFYHHIELQIICIAKIHSCRLH